MGPDIQDFANVADFMYQSMFDSDAFANSPHKPAILAVGTIRNDTQCQLDTNLLEKKIRVALLNSGKVRKDITNGAINDADFTLSGKIIVTHARQGEIRQQTYTFQLSLSNPQGIAVWEDEKEVTKQSKRPSNGF